METLPHGANVYTPEYNTVLPFLAPAGALIVMIVYYIYIYPRPLFQIFTQSLDAIDVTSVTLKTLKQYQCN